MASIYIHKRKNRPDIIRVAWYDPDIKNTKNKYFRIGDREHAEKFKAEIESSKAAQQSDRIDSLPKFHGCYDTAWYECVLEYCEPCDGQCEPLKELPFAYVYMIKARIGELRYMKVGISSDVTKRLCQIARSMPFAELTLHKVAVAPSQEVALRCEKDFHLVCREMSAGGEWFHDYL